LEFLWRKTATTALLQGRPPRIRVRPQRVPVGICRSVPDPARLPAAALGLSMTALRPLVRTARAPRHRASAPATPPARHFAAHSARDQQCCGAIERLPAPRSPQSRSHWIAAPEPSPALLPLRRTARPSGREPVTAWPRL